MAEGLLRDLVGSKGYVVKSAGLTALSCMGASALAVELMKEKGIDISEHVPTILTGDLLEQADIVLVMTESQQQGIANWFTSMKSKIHLLREFDEVKDDEYYPEVPDPMGEGMESYKKCFQIIKRSLKGVVKTL